MGNFKEYQQEHGYVSLREYVDIRFEKVDKDRIEAKTEMERRLEGMNELRQQLDRQAGTFITRDAYEASIDRIMDRINALQKTAVGVLVAILVGLAIYFITGR